MAMRRKRRRRHTLRHLVHVGSRTPRINKTAGAAPRHIGMGITRKPLTDSRKFARFTWIKRQHDACHFSKFCGKHTNKIRNVQLFGQVFVHSCWNILFLHHYMYDWRFDCKGSSAVCQILSLRRKNMPKPKSSPKKRKYMVFWHADYAEYADSYCIRGICRICVENIGCLGTLITQNKQILIVSAESAGSAWKI